MGVRRNFSRGRRLHFACTFQFAGDAVQTGVHKALYRCYAKRICSILGHYSQKCTSLAATARYIAISYKIDSADFSSRVLLYKEANYHGLSQNHKYVIILPCKICHSITWKQEQQTSKISSKRIKHPFNKTLHCIVLYSALAASMKHYTYTGTSTKESTWGRDTEKPEGSLVKVSLKTV